MRLRRNAIGFCLVLVALLTLVSEEGQAQFGSASTSTFGNSSSSSQGGQASAALEQTGQITSEAAIDRGTGFVGGDSSDTFNLRSAPTSGASTGASGRSMSGMSAMGGRGGTGGRGGQTGLNNNNTRNRGRTALRIPFRLGFEMPRVPAPVLRASVQRRIAKLPGLEAGNKVVVVIEKDTAVLQGTVTNSDQGDLIAGLMLLEPGVYKVRNELVVKAPAAKPQ
ncbi:MAG: BON domain-containing protein [Pirellulaceae bacterium]